MTLKTATITVENKHLALYSVFYETSLIVLAHTSSVPQKSLGQEDFLLHLPLSVLTHISRILTCTRHEHMT